MNTKQAKSVIAEKDKTKTVTLYLQNNGNNNFETVKDLIDTIQDYEQWAIKNNRLDEFLNQKVLFQLSDIEGQIVCGDMCLSVGWCGDRFILTGNVQSVGFIKEG